MEHLATGHKEFDPDCSTCNAAGMRDHPHRHGQEKEKGVVSADLFGPTIKSYEENKWALVVVKRTTDQGFLVPMPSKESVVVEESLKTIGLDSREVWRFHADGDANSWGSWTATCAASRSSRPRPAATTRRPTKARR